MKTRERKTYQSDMSTRSYSYLIKLARDLEREVTELEKKLYDEFDENSDLTDKEILDETDKMVDLKEKIHILRNIIKTRKFPDSKAFNRGYGLYTGATHTYSSSYGKMNGKNIYLRGITL